MRGTIIKGIAGFYYVWAEGTVYECRARGIFKKDGITPLVGDDVELSVVAPPGRQPSASSPDMGVGAVDRILKRLNWFERPPVANVELMVLVASVKHPAPSLLMLDRVAIAAEQKNAELVVVVNKTDLAGPQQLTELSEHFRGVYPLILVSALDGSGLDELKSFLKGKKAALAGPSGVGKSSIANLLLGEEKSATGEISRKLGRGKNTTRHSELFKGDGFFLFDTPGFTSFENIGLASREVAGLFPDIAEHAHGCRFSDCRHLSEPGCTVRQAVEEGLISRTRYGSYKEIYKAAAEAEKY